MDDLTPLDVHKDWASAHGATDQISKLKELVRFMARCVAEHDYQQSLDTHNTHHREGSDD